MFLRVKKTMAIQQCQIGLKNGNEVWNSKMAKTDITLIALWGHGIASSPPPRGFDEKPVLDLSSSSATLFYVENTLHHRPIVFSIYVGKC